MRISPATLSQIATLLLIAFSLMGCGPLLPPISAPSTATPVLPPSETSTPCMGGWTWAYGTVTPEFFTQLQDAMKDEGLEGSVEASTFGENDGCGGYHPMAVDYIFTVQVADLEASADLAHKASSVLQIAQRFVELSPAPNLGNLVLTFQNKDQQCGWAYESGAWNLQSRNGTSEAACQVPVTEETQQLAELLNTLSIEFACETSRVTADTQKATLECERNEGDDSYVLNLTFQLNGEGYGGACFHGYEAFESSMSGDQPTTVTENGTTYYQRDRSFQWTANDILFGLMERIKGGRNVNLPSGTHEKVYQRLLQAGVIPGEGSDCQ